MHHLSVYCFIGKIHLIFYWENMVGMMEQLWLYVGSEVHESAFWAMIFAFSQK